MKPDKKDNIQPLDQKDLEKLPKTTFSKNMRNLEDVMAEYIAHGESELTPNELRLLDRQLYEKTGKHIDKYKEKAPKPKDNTPTVSKSYTGNGQPNKKKKPLQVVGKSSVIDAIS